MIKINLLKSYAHTETEFLREQDEHKAVRSEFVKRIALVLIGPAALYAYEIYNIPIIEAQKAALSTQLDTLTAFNQKKEALKIEIAKYEEDSKKLNKKTQFLDRISKERLFPVQMITKIKESIPSDVWLTSIMTTGNRLDIKGSGVTEKAINEFESRLKNIQTFRNVHLNDIDVDVIQADQPTAQNTATTSPVKTSSLRLRKFDLTLEYAVEIPPPEEAVK